MIGREKELEILRQANLSSKAELGIVYGRRRVGKSTLLRAVKSKKSFYFEGVKGLSRQKQIRHFVTQLAAQTNSIPVDAKDWNQALEALTPHIVKGPCYVVFDELPWMASSQSELISFLKFFWDNKWKQNKKLHIVLCGSIASFMVKHVLHSESLHNRKTYEMKLDPLNMQEASQFFPRSTPPDKILQYLICFGGIPKYLEQIDVKESFDKNIERLCFQKNGFFVNEFETVFKEQFKNIKTYEPIVKALANKSQNKESLAKVLKMKSGGGLTESLSNLENADFIKSFVSMSLSGDLKDKTRKFVLWDEWLRFYFKLMKPQMQKIQMNTHQPLFSRFNSSLLNQFYGIGFERLVLKNIPLLLDLLEIQLSDMEYVGPFFQKSRKEKEKGLQIDLMILEKDKTLTIIECKNQKDPVGIGIIQEIDQKIQRLNPPKNYFVKRVLVTVNDVSQDLKKKSYFSKIIYFQDFLKDR